MTDDIFADRVAKVRQRFMSSLGEKIDTTCAALPNLGGTEPPAAAAVAEAYRCIHGIVGIGRTVGFPAIGTAAHDVEDVLRPPFDRDKPPRRSRLDFPRADLAGATRNDPLKGQGAEQRFLYAQTTR